MLIETNYLDVSYLVIAFFSKLKENRVLVELTIYRKAEKSKKIKEGLFLCDVSQYF
jgi:hypothetical protein